MTEALQEKLKTLPAQAGVYFHKDANGKIIYVGKAAILKNRVRQSFQQSRRRDPKTEALVAEIVDTDWITVESEMDALFVEAELVRRYMPRYNILLRDDKSSLYVRINYDDPYPSITFTHRPLDDKAKYFGPFFNGSEVKRALRYLRRVFPYSTHSGVLPKRACLQYHLGLCPGIEEGKTSLNDYRANLRRLMQFLRGEREKLVVKMEADMQKAAQKQDFEKAAEIRNQYYAMKALSKQIVFSDKEFLDISKDRGLQGLADVLGLASVPRRIEGFDISHMQGTDNVASMVVFTNGMPDKANYRKFKMRIPGNDDFAHMHEAITRRCSEKNVKAWGLPDLFLIDGGKGQVAAAVRARDELGINRPMVGLAKREEEIVVHIERSQVNVSKIELHKQNAIVAESDDFLMILLPKNSDIVKLLQRVRDESHRFAVSYHSVLKGKRQVASVLDEVPGIGPVTRKKLIRTFGSLRGVMAASESELETVVGSARAKQIMAALPQTVTPVGGESLIDKNTQI